MLWDIFIQSRGQSRNWSTQISNLRDGLDFGLIDVRRPALTKSSITNIISDAASVKWLDSALHENEKAFWWAAELRIIIANTSFQFPAFWRSRRGNGAVGSDSFLRQTHICPPVILSRLITKQHSDLREMRKYWCLIETNSKQIFRLLRSEKEKLVILPVYCQGTFKGLFSCEASFKTFALSQHSSVTQSDTSLGVLSLCLVLFPAEGAHWLRLNCDESAPVWGYFKSPFTC